MALWQLEFFPHHYGATTTLIPRMPDKKLLDGTPFEALRVVEPMDTQRVWVIWADLPPLPKPAEESGPPPRDPRAPPRLAEVMFSGKKLGKPVQLILLITMECR